MLRLVCRDLKLLVLGMTAWLKVYPTHYQDIGGSGEEERAVKGFWAAYELARGSSITCMYGFKIAARVIQYD